MSATPWALRVEIRPLPRQASAGCQPRARSWAKYPGGSNHGHSLLAHGAPSLNRWRVSESSNYSTTDATPAGEVVRVTIGADASMELAVCWALRHILMSLGFTTILWGSCYHCCHCFTGEGTEGLRGVVTRPPVVMRLERCRAGLKAQCSELQGPHSEVSGMCPPPRCPQKGS